MVREEHRLPRRSSECEAERFRYLWATAPPRLLIIRRGKLLSKILMLMPITFTLAFIANDKPRLATLLLATAFGLTSCAALQPPNPSGPTGTEPLYPILFTEDSNRKESIAAALNRLAQQTANSSSIDTQLQPVTATILNFTPKANSNLYLPKVGANAIMSEEETRESLRRFIREWQEVIGADPAKLSLVERVDQPDGSKLANYEQRTFRYPLRGNYGKLQIRFTADRRILNLTSTCIPDAERMQTILSGVSIRLKAEDAVKQVRDKGLEYTDPQGNKLTFKVPAADAINPRGLVTYILQSKDKPDALEFRLAWEMELSNAPVKIAYIDAVSGDTIAVE
jgi:hypothetical protein